MMSERTEILKSFDGNDLFFRCYTPKRKDMRRTRLDGVILAVHDFGDHSGRYAKLAALACAHNMALASFDLRGHGKSGPKKGDAENLHALILDVLFVINHARGILGFSRKQESFLGLFGQGFGGLLVTYAAASLRDFCPPVFLSAPLFRSTHKISRWQKIATNSLPQILPSLPFSSLYFSEDLSENKENASAWRTDPLTLKTVSVRLNQIFSDATNDDRVRHAISLVHTPVAIACGNKDKIADTTRTKELFPYLASQSTGMIVIDDAGHDIFNEENEAYDTAAAFFENWLSSKGVP